jgi:hypothetical protein
VADLDHRFSSVHCTFAIPSELLTSDAVKTFRRQGSLLGMKISQLVTRAEAIAAHVISTQLFRRDVYVFVVEKNSDGQLYSCSVLQSKSGVGRSRHRQLEHAIQMTLTKIDQSNYFDQLANPPHLQSGNIAAAVFGGERNEIIWLTAPEESEGDGASCLAESYRGSPARV